MVWIPRTFVCMAFDRASLAAPLDKLAVLTSLPLIFNKKFKTLCKTRKPNKPDKAADPFSRFARPTETPTAKITGKLLKAVPPSAMKNFMTNWKIALFKKGNILSVFSLVKAVPIPWIIPAPGSTETGSKNERPNCSKAEINLFFSFIFFAPCIFLFSF